MRRSVGYGGSDLDAFGIIGRTGPGMRQIVRFGDRFGDRSTGMGTFFGGGANLRRAIVTNGDLLSQRRSPLSKLRWANLSLLLLQIFVILDRDLLLINVAGHLNHTYIPYVLYSIV